MGVRPKVSVIVPMYNVETFLSQCVDSIRTQTLADIEIILVDDGSPDRSRYIAEEYARRDNRVRVVHRLNGGLGPARNSGLEIATGEFVGFVDSDDWIEPDMYEALYEAALMHGADIAFTGIKTVSYGVVTEVREQPMAGKVLMGSNEIYRVRAACYGPLPCKLKDDPTPVSVCTGVYSRDFLNKNHLRFHNIRSEDKIFNIEAGRHAKVLVCIGGAPYCYRRDNQSSITSSFNIGISNSYFELFRLLEQMAEDEPNCFRDDSLARARRCIIDYSRVLIRMIEGSSEMKEVKIESILEVMNNPALRRALAQFPFWRLPTAQALFYMALKSRSVCIARTISKLKRRRY